MVAAVDVKRFARNEARCVVREEGGGDANIVDAHEAARRRLGFRLVEQLVPLRVFLVRRVFERAYRRG